MSSLAENIRSLSRSEKVALMETLWNDLSVGPQELEPPSWHEDVLASRRHEWENRDTVSEDWNEVKRSLRNSL